MDRPLLSISILTFNRARFLPEMLRSLVPQVNRHRGSVEILVNDNASTDDTADVVRAFSAEMGGIRYHRNERNLGFISNYYLSLRRSCGNFVCLSGDDDIYEDSFIELAIATIQGVDPDLILFNRSVWNRHMTARIQDRLMPIETGLVYPGIMDLARVHGLATNIAFNSAVIFRRMPGKVADISYCLRAQFPYPQIELYLRAFGEARCVVVPVVALRQRQFNSVMRELGVTPDATNSPMAASVGWIDAFLHFDRQGLTSFLSLFETRERDLWVNGTMADFIILNLRRGMANGAVNLGHVACVLEAVHKLPEGEIRSRLFEFVVLAIDRVRLTERLLSLR